MCLNISSLVAAMLPLFPFSSPIQNAGASNVTRGLSLVVNST